MPRPTPLLLIAVLTLGACQAVGGHPGAAPRATASANASPGTKTSGGAIAPTKKLVAHLLRKPATPSTAVSGVLAIDGVYVQAAAQGTLIGQDGSSLVTVGGKQLIGQDGTSLIGQDGTSLIGQDGTSLIAQDGSSIVAAGAGNVIRTDAAQILANDGATLVGQDGTSLIGQDGSSVVAGGAGNVVAGGAGNVVAGGAGNFRLLAASDAITTQAGIPAAGMAVRVISLVDNRPLPLGVDEDGKPVYVVNTDLSGRYTLYLPADLHGNLRVVASAVGAVDPRLSYSLVAKPAAEQPQGFTEESALVSEYIRICMKRQLFVAMEATTRSGGGSYETFIEQLPKQVRPLLADGLKAPFDQLDAHWTAAGVASLPLTGRMRVVQRIADVMTAALPLATMDTLATTEGVPSIKVLDALGHTMMRVRQGAAERLNLDPHSLDAAPYILDALERRRLRDDEPIEIRNASDVARLLIEDYLGTVEEGEQYKMEMMLADLGLTPLEIRQCDDAVRSLTVQLISTFLGDGGELTGTADKVSAAIDEEAAAQRAHPSADREPHPVPQPLPPLEATVVTTLAGTASPGLKDGAGAQAAFSGPTHLVLDPSGSALFVSDSLNGTLRRIGLDDPSHPVTTVLPAHTFNRPSGLAFGDDGTLYVGDRNAGKVMAVHFDKAGVATASLLAMVPFAEGLAFDKNRHRLLVTSVFDDHLRAVDLSASTHEVTTVLGGGKNERLGSLPASDAIRLSGPTGIAVDGDVIYLLESGVHWLRRWDLGSGRLEVIAGGAMQRFADGDWANALFRAPYGITLSGGDLFVADTLNHRIRRVRPRDWTSGPTHDAFGARYTSTTTTLAGDGPVSLESPPPEAWGKFADGPGVDARFSSPWGVAVKGRVVYVADSRNNRIRAIELP